MGQRFQQDDHIHTPTAGVNPQNRALPFGLVQPQGAIRRLDQRTQGGGQLVFSGKHPLHHHLFVIGSQDVADLTPLTVAWVAEVAPAGKRRLRPAGPPGEVYVQQLLFQVVGMTVSLLCLQ